MSNLQILTNSIRTFENLYSLNDLHRASGSASKHQPTFFIRLDTTKDLVAEIQNQEPNNQVIVSKNGIGTYACKELVIAYAAWISPAFHLTVLRAFLNQAENLQNSQPNIPLVIKPTQPELETLFKILNYAQMYRDFCKMAVTTPQKIHWSKIALNDDSQGILFAFKPEIDRDIKQGIDLIGKLADVAQLGKQLAVGDLGNQY